MSNEELIHYNNPSGKNFLRLIRVSSFVECLSNVKVHINDVEVAVLKNGQEIVLPVNAGDVFELDLQGSAWHNNFKVSIEGNAMIEFGYSFWKKKNTIFYNNLHILRSAGCHLYELDKKRTDLQKRDLTFRMVAIGICLIMMMFLQLAKCRSGCW